MAGSKASLSRFRIRATLRAQLGIALIQQVGAEANAHPIKDELGQEDAGQTTQQKALAIEATTRPAAQQDAEQQVEADGHRGDQHHHRGQLLKIQAQPELGPSNSQRGLVLAKE